MSGGEGRKLSAISEPHPALWPHLSSCGGSLLAGLSWVPAVWRAMIWEFPKKNRAILCTIYIYI